MVFMPKSPRWLVNRNKDSEAISILAKLRATKSESTLVQLEYTEIKNGIALERTVGTANWSELTKKGILNRVIVAVISKTYNFISRCYFKLFSNGLVSTSFFTTQVIYFQTWDSEVQPHHPFS